MNGWIVTKDSQPPPPETDEDLAENALIEGEKPSSDGEGEGEGEEDASEEDEPVEVMSTSEALAACEALKIYLRQCGEDNVCLIEATERQILKAKSQQSVQVTLQQFLTPSTSGKNAPRKYATPSTPKTPVGPKTGTSVRRVLITSTPVNPDTPTTSKRRRESGDLAVPLSPVTKRIRLDSFASTFSLTPDLDARIADLPDVEMIRVKTPAKKNSPAKKKAPAKKKNPAKKKLSDLTPVMNEMLAISIIFHTGLTCNDRTSVSNTISIINIRTAPHIACT